MSKFKGLPEVVVNAFRGSWRDLVQEMGGVDRTSRVCQMSIGQVSTAGREHGDCLPTIAAIYLAEQDAKKPYITSVLAGATGHHLIPHEPLAPGELAVLLAQIGAESGEVFGAYARALADDGLVDAEERAEIRRKLGDVKRAVLAAIAHCDAPPAPVGADARAA